MSIPYLIFRKHTNYSSFMLTGMELPVTTVTPNHHRVAAKPWRFEFAIGIVSIRARPSHGGLLPYDGFDDIHIIWILT